MDAHLIQAGFFPNPPPLGKGEASQASIRPAAHHPRSAFGPPDSVKHRHIGIGYRHRAWDGLAVGQPQCARAAVEIVPTREQDLDLVRQAARQRQWAQRSDRGRLSLPFISSAVETLEFCI